MPNGGLYRTDELGRDNETMARLMRERDEARADVERVKTSELAERGRAVRLEMEVSRLRALLREVEWVEAWDDEGAEWWFCAVCRCDKSDGHAPDCRLAAALEGRDA